MRPDPPVWAPSPNHNERPGAPDMVVLHYTGMQSGAAALERLCDPAAQVSAHYLIEEDGRVFALVAEERRAWHAGLSFWAGERDINGRSIGVEIVNPGHEFGYRPFPQVQIEAVLALLDAIRGRWTIPDARIVGHSDVAPARKQDPGELFPWARLARAGHGIWSEAVASSAGLSSGAARRALAAIGYEVAPAPEEAPLAADERLSLIAFQRHWAPARLDAELDGLTGARLLDVARRVQGA